MDFRQFVPTKAEFRANPIGIVFGYAFLLVISLPGIALLLAVVWFATRQFRQHPIAGAFGLLVLGAALARWDWIQRHWRELPEHRRGGIFVTLMFAFCFYYYFVLDHSIRPVYHEATHSYTFGGYDCASNCSRHVAGYKWAGEHDIDSEEDCKGDSQSFVEGCKVWVAEYEEGMEAINEQPYGE
jgi:hypothetical protein